MVVTANPKWYRIQSCLRLRSMGRAKKILFLGLIMATLIFYLRPKIEVFHPDYFDHVPRELTPRFQPNEIELTRQHFLSRAQDSVSRLSTDNFYSIWRYDEHKYHSPDLTTWMTSNALFLERHIHLKMGSILDVEIRYGTLTTFLRLLSKNDTACYAIDSTGTYLSPEIRKSLRIDLYTINFETDPLPPKVDVEQYDHIILSEVLDNWKYNPIPSLKKLANMLSPYGSLYISTHHRETVSTPFRWQDLPDPQPGGRSAKLRQDSYKWNMQDLKDVLRQVGLVVVRGSRNPYGRVMVEARKPAPGLFELTP
jgi:SAM-dependent methyltransferase